MAIVRDSCRPLDSCHRVTNEPEISSCIVLLFSFCTHLWPETLEKLCNPSPILLGVNETLCVSVEFTNKFRVKWE